MNLATTHSRPSSPGRASYLGDMALLLVGGFAFLVGTILWLDNAQGGLTGNGIFKAMDLRPWIEDPANAPLYPSNYLFFPFYGVGGRLLDLLGVFRGDPRHQLTIMNAFSASVCLTIVYALIRQITGERAIAFACAFFHIACNDVLFLAIINEDIMSSYTIMFSSMALGGLWFARPTMVRVVIVSILFSIGWLFEWRLMFPTLPAMAVALWFCEDRIAKRVGWIALFLAVMVACASIAVLATRGHENAVDNPWGLLWTGKAVDSAWGGFTWAKLYFMQDGLAAYLLGTRFANQFTGIPGWDIWRFTAMGCELAIAVVTLGALWRTREDKRSWSLFGVFGGTLVAGEVFNLYSQPHDPQMQLNVMAWTTVGWAFVLLAARRRWGRRGFASMIGLSVLMLAFNIWCLDEVRGMDSAWSGAIQRLGRKFDITRTVFLAHDFDWSNSYAASAWGNSWPEVDGNRLGPAPQTTPKYKRIGFVGGILQHHMRTEAEQVAALRAQIDLALQLGYDVVAIRLWDVDPTFLTALTTSITTESIALGMLDMLHRDFVATEAVDDPVLGKVYLLQKKPGR